MVKAVLKTSDSVALLFIRLALGVVMFPHGAQKVFGWFGGPGFSKTLEVFNLQFGFPSALTGLVMAIELLGSIGLITGFFTRLSALAIGASIASCALMNHVQNGFFMNWFGAQPGEGIEYHLLVVGIALALAIKGGGMFSVDKAFSRE